MEEIVKKTKTTTNTLYDSVYKFVNEDEMDDFRGKYSISKMTKDRKSKPTFP